MEKGVKLKLPALFINFKTYREATGSEAISLAKIAQKASDETGKKIVLVPQAVDLHAISREVSLPIYAQHIDPVTYGSNTGKILPEAIKEAGATGTILNHAENKRENEFIKSAIARAKELSLEVMLCAESEQRAKELAEFAPNLIAYEPPELIGDPNISVANAKPEILTSTLNTINSINPETALIAGAGIHSIEDIQKSIELGAKGAFVASHIMRSKDKKEAIVGLLNGFP